ncbi:FG-GAP repeat domain-containing protein [Herpetosiphon giganteus]|uniref:FG-GAP repeat domain-containing protein n=1 Tax=Herpetosiphon giganteus TaxID=2029754 RepID=UPI001EF7FC38|nr:VCBS repeat-containing protein [Herpetosiphon giganteus]MBM7846528.1 hypothetical protein [Herpetosiphon giganteus]
MGDIDNTPNPVRQFSIELRNVATGAQTVSPLQSTTAWTTPPLADGTYTWRVRAYDGALYSEWSSRRIVTVNTKYANMFADGGIWSAPSGAGSDQIYRGDIDGDKRDDLLVATSRINGATQGLTWYWLRNTGSTFIYAGTVSSSYGRASDTFYVGDIDGDGKDDLLTATARVSGNTTLTWYWLRSTGAGFEDRGIINQFYGSIGDQFFVADVDGDGKDDLLTGTTRLTGTSTGLTWYWLRSTGTTMEDRGIISQAYGIENDLIYSADFDGDGDDDMILASTRFHPETTHMTWYWMRNDGTSFAYAGILQDAYGIASDRFYVADFDGDGKDDLLTATPRINGNTTLTWYWLRSTGTSFEDRGVMSQAYGGSADQFYVADFDGDGKDDLLTATTRVNGSANPLTWYWLRSTGTSFEDRGVMSQADVVTI